MSGHPAKAIRWRRGVLATSQLLACITLLLMLSGCTKEDSELTAMRGRLLLEQAPVDAVSITEAQSAVSENANVSIVARIALDEHEAFMPGQATLVVTEIPEDEDGHGGKEHADNCPFCKRKAAKAPRAAVQFVNESGEPLHADVRELLGVKCGDEVVIQGKGELLAELDIFQVMANGIYLQDRRSE